MGVSKVYLLADESVGLMAVMKVAYLVEKLAEK
jgi:hypothetical protein